MTEEDIAKIQETIRATVNGKIDRLQVALDAHVIQHEEDQKRLALYQEQMKPLLDSFNNWSWLKKMLFTIFFPTITAIGALGGVVSLLNYFQNR